MKITAAIIAFNEEAKIGRALRSVEWADEILVVDSGSTDRTTEIAAEHGARVITNPWPGFSAQKQFANDAAQNDWIFSLDADEEVSDGLRREIQSVLDSGPDRDGYRVPRLSFYMDRPIRHSGWYPDRQLRLFDRRKAHWKDALIHESVKVDGPVGDLTNDLHHYSVDDAAHHHRMIGERYAPLAAEQMLRDGRPSGPFRIAIAGPAAFFRSYVLKLGFMDGLPGFVIAKFAAHHAFLKHLLLYELRKSR